jgi:hypothetical protein
MWIIVKGLVRVETAECLPLILALFNTVAGISYAAGMPLSLPRNAQLWLPSLLTWKLHRTRPRRFYTGLTEILFCIVDHFEPGLAEPGVAIERERVAAWVERYPRLVEQFVDADGRPPQHTFFFPEEGYRPELLDQLAGLRDRGFGDVEVHLHHDRDTPDRLRERLERFITLLAQKHGLLHRRHNGDVSFGFIHGNWALDNARPDGKWCGVNNELTILRETGCYADFTLPAAPDPSQTRTINSIYYAVDDPDHPRSHEFGVAAAVGRKPPDDGLLIIQGPLTFDWRRRVWKVLPGLENSAVDSSPAHLPTLERFATWVDVGVSIQGRPEWIFVKVHTHGAPEHNAAILLGPVMERFHSQIQSAFNDGERYRLHYVTAYEMAMLVKAAEAGLTGNPGELRNHSLI